MAVEQKGCVPSLQDDTQTLEEVFDGISIAAGMVMPHPSRDLADLDDGVCLPTASVSTTNGMKVTSMQASSWFLRTGYRVPLHQLAYRCNNCCSLADSISQQKEGLAYTIEGEIWQHMIPLDGQKYKPVAMLIHVNAEGID
jgi:hypothetical protein